MKFTAIVRSGYGVPTGTVVFYNGSAVLGSATLSGEVATLSTNALGVGSHSIKAVYEGGGFAASTSAPLNQVVEQ